MKEKRSQITVFIILGILILFIAIFMIQLTKQTKIGGLEQEQEKVVSRVFGKEGLKIFVDDCLEDGLENGLVLLGKHGRIPKEEGGLAEFSKITGVEYPTSEDKLFYAITNKDHYPPEQYPCLDGEKQDFCQYRFPNSSVLPGHLIKFGERKLSMKYIEADLESYLKEGLTDCLVKDITETTKGAISIDTETEEIELELEILNDGIKIKTEYPLKFSLGGEEVFHLETFDFFYEAKELKYFLESTVTRPLNYEWSFVDFNYKAEVESGKPSFKHDCLDDKGNIKKEKCQEPLLSTEASVNRNELADGDDLFIFKINKNLIFKPGTTVISSNDPFYTFQFARQNRPPALDYINRSQCDGEYDYLVISGHDKLGKIDITLTAQDPDEDAISSYSFKSDPILIDGASEPEKFLVTSPLSGNYKVTATISDGSLEDKQEIRVAVDPPIATKISLEMPYSDVVYKDPKTGSRYDVSIEDPFFLKITLPKKPIIGTKKDIVLSYDGQVLIPNIKQDYGKTVCFGFPDGKLGSCDIDDYKDPWIDFKPFDVVTDPNLQTLKVEHTLTYCDGQSQQSDTSEIEIRVNECIPNIDKTHPWPFPYHNYDGNGKLIEGSDINPFLASHTCCKNDWTVYKKEDKKPCFKEKKLGCFGELKPAVLGLDGYLLEKKIFVAYCTGDRGNICSGNKELFSHEPQNVCGDKNNKEHEGCGNVDDGCENQKPWHVQLGQGGFWCGSTLGCGKYCNKIVVDSGDGFLFNNEFDICRSCGPTDLGKSCYDFKKGIQGTCQKEKTWWGGTREVCK